ncbi:MAG: hypothetical protein D3910_02775 [Candidatus Electrothrix sp. ATG2]|nr:hypothetical protein [Candidatus Electrothrix sp. ATG2]
MLDIPPQSSVITTQIVGLGNPILGDDGVGWRGAEEVSKQSDIALGDAHRVAYPVHEKYGIIFH